ETDIPGSASKPTISKRVVGNARRILGAAPSVSETFEEGNLVPVAPTQLNKHHGGRQYGEHSKAAGVGYLGGKQQEFVKDFPSLPRLGKNFCPVKGPQSLPRCAQYWFWGEFPSPLQTELSGSTERTQTSCKAE